MEVSLICVLCQNSIDNGNSISPQIVFSHSIFHRRLCDILPSHISHMLPPRSFCAVQDSKSKPHTQYDYNTLSSPSLGERRVMTTKTTPAFAFCHLSLGASSHYVRGPHSVSIYHVLYGMLSWLVICVVYGICVVYSTQFVIYTNQRSVSGAYMAFRCFDFYLSWCMWF